MVLASPPEEAAPATHGKEASSNRPLSGTAAVAWIGQDGKPRLETPLLKGQSRDSIEIELGEPVTVDQKVWLVRDDGNAYPGVIRTCAEDQGQFAVSVGLIHAQPAPTGDPEAFGSTHLGWINDSGGFVQSSASLKNAQPGQVQVTTTEPVPASILVLVSAKSFHCLGTISSSRQEGDRWLVEVEVLGDAFSAPKPV